MPNFVFDVASRLLISYMVGRDRLVRQQGNLVDGVGSFQKVGK